MLGFHDAPPLLKMEWNALFDALVANAPNPFRVHRTSTGPAFAADNHPVDSGKVKFAQITNKRLKRQEFDLRASVAQMIDPE